MRKVFKDIARITKEIGVTKEKNVCKLVEEFGELGQEMNKEFGIKNGILDRKEIKGELADCIQILISIANQYNITYNELVAELNAKNIKWLNKYKEEVILKTKVKAKIKIKKKAK